MEKVQTKRVFLNDNPLFITPEMEHKILHLLDDSEQVDREEGLREDEDITAFTLELISDCYGLSKKLEQDEMSTDEEENTQRAPWDPVKRRPMASPMGSPKRAHTRAGAQFTEPLPPRPKAARRLAFCDQPTSTPDAPKPGPEPPGQASNGESNSSSTEKKE